MEPLQKQFIEHFAVIEFDGIYTLDLDNSRYINHSKNPNIVFPNNKIGIAICDINIGDELTFDYTTLYDKPIWFEEF